MTELSIIIPCYNEEKNIHLIVEKLKDVLNKKEFELVLVDNGSADNTQQEIKKYSKIHKNIRLVIVPQNIGYGWGILKGLESAKGEFLSWTHADLQTDPNDAIKALDIIKKQQNPEKIYVKGNRKQRTLFNKFFEVGMSIFETMILRTYLYDINAQPSLFHKSFLNLIKNPPKDFSFDLYMYYIAKINKYQISRFPVLFPKRIHGESTWNTGIKSRFKMIKRTLSYSFKLKSLLETGNS